MFSLKDNNKNMNNIKKSEKKNKTSILEGSRAREIPLNSERL